MSDNIFTTEASSNSTHFNPNTRIICRVCEKQFSQYTCPRCNIRYCSLHCYKSHSLRCTESFMRENVMEELQQVQSDENSKFKMMEILKRFHEEEEADSLDEEDSVSSFSEETIQKILSGGQINFDDLSIEEKKHFQRAVASGELGKLIQPWDPWWLKPSAKHIALSPDGTHLVHPIPNSESTSPEKWADVPHGPESPLPPVSQLTASSPSPLLPVHLVDIIYSYCFTLRLYNGDWGADPLDASTVVLTVSSVLGSAGKPQTVLEALLDCLERTCSPVYKQMGGLKLGMRIVDDVICLLCLGGNALVCALCDMRRLVQKGERELKSEKVDKLRRAELRGKLKSAERKIYFVMCWVREQANESCSLLAGVVEKEKEFAVEQSGGKGSGVKLEGKSGISGKPLIKEVEGSFSLTFVCVDKQFEIPQTFFRTGGKWLVESFQNFLLCKCGILVLSPIKDELLEERLSEFVLFKDRLDGSLFIPERISYQQLVEMIKQNCWFGEGWTMKDITLIVEQRDGSLNFLRLNNESVLQYIYYLTPMSTVYLHLSLEAITPVTQVEDVWGCYGGEVDVDGTSTSHLRNFGERTSSTMQWENENWEEEEGDEDFVPGEEDFTDETSESESDRSINEESEPELIEEEDPLPSGGRHIYREMGEWEPSKIDENEYALPRWNDDIETIPHPEMQAAIQYAKSLLYTSLTVGGGEIGQGTSSSQVLSQESYVQPQRTQSHRARHQPPPHIRGGRRRRHREPVADAGPEEQQEEGAALDMSLDDLIKSNKKSAARGRGRGGGGGGPGPARRQPNRSNRAAPYAPPKAPDSVWGHDLFSGGGGGRAPASGIETGTKLYISNLDYGVSNEDIKVITACGSDPNHHIKMQMALQPMIECMSPSSWVAGGWGFGWDEQQRKRFTLGSDVNLVSSFFPEVGDLKRYNVHYDRSGRSKGTADVVFSRRQDALAAIKKYNNVQLDGKPMKIEIVRTNIPTVGAGVDAGLGFPSTGAFGAPITVPRSGQGRGSFGRQRGGGRGRGFGRGRGGGRGKGRDEKISAEDLDADLDKYHAESMQTN
ncbi:RNA-binding (RRM/RBD/RNP motifs) family protein [Striga asiatica]|uniref:RNA-binding (RRM/RBD/RNP motifs) family protein n=1 Tax=Striga asiatica TaxID=4170 RepID=A0A5A7NYW4_STRAF|nr:RNA-binding (RRM/RBD/RNP motifs) family protein [Striga asiatica]